MNVREAIKQHCWFNFFPRHLWFAETDLELVDVTKRIDRAKKQLKALKGWIKSYPEDTDKYIEEIKEFKKQIKELKMNKDDSKIALTKLKGYPPAWDECFTSSDKKQIKELT